ATTIWFSASCNLTILPNSVGLPALPFRITSVDGSNRLTILFSAWVSPAKTRALVWRIPCRPRGTMLSSSRRSPSSRTCRRVSAARLTPSPISVAKRFACPTTRPVASSQSAVSLRQLLAALPTFGAGRPRDLQHPPFDAAAAIAQLGAGRPSDTGDLLHHAGHNPLPVAQQAAVGGVVNVGLDHRGVDAHPPAFRHPIVARDLHDPFMDLFDHRRPHGDAPTAHGLGVGHLGAAHPGEVAIHQ